MIPRKIILGKIFPRKNNIDMSKLKIDEETLCYITAPFESGKIGNLIIDKMKKYNKEPKEITIVDATACVGGDTITFCNLFGYVFPIEENNERYEHLKNNLKVYGFLDINAYPILGNSLDVIPNIERPINVIYVDPPWGGPDYKNLNKLELTFGGKDLDVVVKELFNTSHHIKLVTLKLPKNYDHLNFSTKLGINYKISIHSLRKMDIVMIERLDS